MQWAIDTRASWSCIVCVHRETHCPKYVFNELAREAIKRPNFDREIIWNLTPNLTRAHARKNDWPCDLLIR